MTGQKKQPKPYDYLIVGAGLYGATFAALAKKAGKRVLVVEKRYLLGGNAACESVDGIIVHKYGPHIFHTSDERVWAFVNEYAEFNDFVNMPIANYKGELYHLPFNMNTFAELWGVKSVEEAKRVLNEQTRKHKTEEPKNLREAALSAVGEDIYFKLIEGYTEKQWGRKCEELPPFIIKRIPLRFTYDNNYYNDSYQGIPIDGYSAMVERMLEGCDILRDVDYFDFTLGHPDIAEKTVYTGAIDKFFGYCYGALEYRSLRFETERSGIPDLQGVAVMNFCDRETEYTRRIEHKHFSGAKSDCTIVSYEYPVKWENGMEPYYPVNDDKNNALYLKYARMAKEKRDIIFGGRLGEYRYLDMDKTIVAAISTAEKELGVKQ